MGGEKATRPNQSTSRGAEPANRRGAALSAAAAKIGREGEWTDIQELEDRFSDKNSVSSSGKRRSMERRSEC